MTYYLNRILFVPVALASIVLLFGCTSQNTENNIIVFKGATLIIGDGSEPIEKSVVIIENDEIISVGQLGETKIPKDAKIIDLKDRWIIPGLMDLHFHINDLEQQEVLTTLLQFGITTIRNTAATPEFGVQLRDKISSGEITGPRMFTSGELIDITGGFWSDSPSAVGVKTENEMRSEVRKQAAMGVDFVKLYAHLEPNLNRAGIDEANKVGVKSIGHLGKTSWTDAANFGINALTHSGTAAPTWELVPAKSQAQFNDFFAPHQKPEFDHTLFGPWLELVDLDGPEMTSLISAVVNNQVEINPTLVIVEVMFWGDDPDVHEAYEPDYAPKSLTNKWREGPHPYTKAWPPESLNEAKKVFLINQEIVRKLYEAGALITTGTDFPLPWVTPGVALHREMLLIRNSGIPAKDVITIATRNGAEALGILDEVGTIEIGKHADFVILKADPLKDIRNTREIEEVYLGGNVVYSMKSNN